MKSVVQRILDYVYVANVIANETTFLRLLRLAFLQSIGQETMARSGIFFSSFPYS